MTPLPFIAIGGAFMTGLLVAGGPEGAADGASLKTEANGFPASPPDAGAGAPLAVGKAA